MVCMLVCLSAGTGGRDEKSKAWLVGRMFANPDRSRRCLGPSFEEGVPPAAQAAGCHWRACSYGVVETWNSSSAAQQAPGKVISEFLDEGVRATPTAVGLWQGTELWPLGLELSQAGPTGLIGLHSSGAPVRTNRVYPTDPRRQVWGINWESAELVGARPEMGQGARSAPRGEFSSGAPIPRCTCTLRCTLHIHRGFASRHAKPLDGRARSGRAPA